jgi:hypothetical protein
MLYHISRFQSNQVDPSFFDYRPPCPGFRPFGQFDDSPSMEIELAAKPDATAFLG